VNDELGAVAHASRGDFEALGHLVDRVALGHFGDGLFGAVVASLHLDVPPCPALGAPGSRPGWTRTRGSGHPVDGPWYN